MADQLTFDKLEKGRTYYAEFLGANNKQRIVVFNFKGYYEPEDSHRFIEFYAAYFDDLHQTKDSISRFSYREASEMTPDITNIREANLEELGKLGQEIAKRLSV